MASRQIGRSDMCYVDIATKLLNSKDKSVAAAAKRIFSPTEPESFSQISPPKKEIKSHVDFTIDSDNQFSSADIRDAARAVAMLAPQNERSTALSVSSPFGNSMTKTDSQTMNSIPTNFNAMVHTTTKNSYTHAKQAGKKATTPQERLERSRERNKIHARRTRQRKKEHMQDLDKMANELKQNQLSLKQLINEKNTACILAAMFSTEVGEDSKSEADLRVEELLKRPTESIPDASKIPELPALLLPGQHSNRKRALNKDDTNIMSGNLTDGIDYSLLTKDRSRCTPAELDMIRRERNRMHAKRTRDRKKRFMDVMQNIIKQLKEENDLLREHLRTLSENHVRASGITTPSLESPKFESCTGNMISPLVSLNGDDTNIQNKERSGAVSAGETVSIYGCISSHSQLPPKKRHCFAGSCDGNIPSSITTTKMVDT